MGYCCCVTGCKTGYRSVKQAVKPALFRFPKSEVLKKKWCAAIPRKHFVWTKNKRVCAQHFVDEDFQASSIDKKLYRKNKRNNQSLKSLRLKPNAIPHIFPGLPKYLSNPAVAPRETFATSSARLQNENERLQGKYNEFFAKDSIDSFASLKIKISEMVIPDGYIFSFIDNHLYFHLIQLSEFSIAPKMLASVVIKENLSLMAFVSSSKVATSRFHHLLQNDFLTSLTALSNVLAHCKALAEDPGSQDFLCIELAVSLLEQYVSCTLGKESNINRDLFTFLIEQLQLIPSAKEARRYSTRTLSMAFFWQLSSTSLYNKLRNVFILPAVSRLRMYSSGLSVKAGNFDFTYLKQRTEGLQKHERVVTLMIDEVCTAKRVEYTNGSFVGLTEEGDTAKTVLAFMVQSTCSNYKDIVCLVPVNRLDTALLKEWFSKVMEALSDIFLVIAASVDNHICNRKMFVDLCGGELKPFVPHPTKRGELLFLLFDFTHNLKNLFNNFLSKYKMSVPTSGFESLLGSSSSCEAYFAHIKQVYAIEEDKSLKIAHSLKKALLNPSNIARTSPYHAIGVFSESTARALEFYGQTHPQFLSTSRYVTFIGNVWKIMSVKNPSKGYKKADDMCKPLQGGDKEQANYAFLCQALDVLKLWKQSGQSGLTQETFSACIQSIEGIIALADHLATKHNFKYVLPGKFSSDPIEGRFGWYRQSNGGNFFMSIKQLFEAEKKIRCLSLLQQEALHHTLQMLAQDHCPDEEILHDFIESDWLYEFLQGANMDDFPESDASITYYVSGYVGRSISRRRRCSSCKDLLVKSTQCISLPVDVSEEHSAILQMADRGGMSAPTEYCFAICGLAVQLYSFILTDDWARKKMLSLKNQRSAFVSAVWKIAEVSEVHSVLLSPKCLHGHNNFTYILQVVFNCFAKNELKRINQCANMPEKMTRSIRKLSSKSSTSR